MTWVRLKIYVNVLHPFFRSTELHAAVVCACMPTLRPFLRSCSSSLKGIYAGNDTMSLHSRHRTAQRVLERDEDGHIELRKLKVDTTQSPCHEDGSMIVDVQRNRHNTSEEFILGDGNPIPAESHGTFRRKQGLGENGGLEIQTL